MTSRLCVGVRIRHTQARMMDNVVLPQASEGNRHEPPLDRKRLATLSGPAEGPLGKRADPGPGRGLIAWTGADSLGQIRSFQLPNPSIQRHLDLKGAHPSRRPARSHPDQCRRRDQRYRTSGCGGPPRTADRSRPTAGGDIGLSTAEPLLRHRKAIQRRLEPLRQHPPGLGTSPSGVRFRSQPSDIRLFIRPSDPNRLRGLSGRQGVCRDFAHLALSLCRCLNIPARYCTGYLGDVGVPPAVQKDFEPAGEIHGRIHRVWTNEVH